MQINEDVQIFIFKEYSKCGFGHNADSIQGGFFFYKTDIHIVYTYICTLTHRDQ